MAAKWFARSRSGAERRCTRRRRAAAGGTTRAAPSASPRARADPECRVPPAVARPSGYAGPALLAPVVLAEACRELYLGPGPSAGDGGLPDALRHRILLLGNPASRPDGLERVLVRG